MTPVYLNVHLVMRLLFFSRRCPTNAVNTLLNEEFMEAETAHFHEAVNDFLGELRLSHLRHARTENRRRDFLTLFLSGLRDGQRIF
jgi:hypothetical protein